MTKAQARTEARRRWSQRGAFGPTVVCLQATKSLPHYRVGYLLWKDAQRERCETLLLGEATWETALANAAEREAAGLPPLREGFL